MPYQYVKKTMPENNAPKITPIIESVKAAFFSDGALKLGIAFDIASTPVNAEHPDEKAFNMRNKPMPATG